MLSIGPFIRSSKVIVAPMAGVSDQPFRNLCREFGAQWVVSEMVTSDSRLWKTRKSQQRLRFHDEVEPRWIQIAGAEPAQMANAAIQNVMLGAQIIDINMGCPAKKVCRRAAGSALLRDEVLVESILKSVVAAVDVPVTLKIRLGWSKEEINAGRIARIAEDCGVALLTVHGRTRECRFKGDVDYEAIADVKSSVTIPVIANGDIVSPEQARSVLDITKADGVMVGRAAQGRPWLPAMISEYLNTGLSPSEPTDQVVRNTLKKHIETLSVFHGEESGVRIARKHVGWYLEAWSGRRQGSCFNKLDSLDAQLRFVDELFSRQGLAA
jgi:tRNA-dihydrouridine synthase B